MYIRCISFCFINTPYTQVTQHKTRLTHTPTQMLNCKIYVTYYDWHGSAKLVVGHNKREPWTARLFGLDSTGFAGNLRRPLGLTLRPRHHWWCGVPTSSSTRSWILLRIIRRIGFQFSSLTRVCKRKEPEKLSSIESDAMRKYIAFECSRSWAIGSGWDLSVRAWRIIFKCASAHALQAS